MAMSITEYLNLNIWASGIPAITYLNGTLLFIAGLSLVRLHQIWKEWPIIISIISWLLLSAGLLRMTFPHAKQIEGSASLIIFIVMFLVGSFLAYQAYFPSKSNTYYNCYAKWKYIYRLISTLFKIFS